LLYVLLQLAMYVTYEFMLLEAGHLGERLVIRDCHTKYKDAYTYVVHLLGLCSICYRQKKETHKWQGYASIFNRIISIQYL